MADFRQLALEFVLADDEAKLTSLARQAASEIQNAPSPSMPVARWVEAVQPWMPGGSGNGDEITAEGDTPDWTARAKALDFLSRTLDFLDSNVLKTSQVQLLINFFGAMFDIDHKAGIMASATALSRIVAMRAFQPASARDIIKSVCTLKDDFLRQVAKTRLAVFELLRSLITNEDVAAALQKEGDSCDFMSDLLQLCQTERDPSCLMVWFETLTFFLRRYPATQEVLEKVYGVFKAYFPITLPRSSQSGFTPDELKMKLRECFAANSRLSHLTFPFLLSKLDQGDGVTVNVKLDVLRTIQACLESYEPVKEHVSPYVNQIWGSLKYEVRNGEIEDAIWATLETLKTLATRLDPDDLRDYALAVTRDCVNDLSNPTYSAAAGRLLVGVMSATPAAFILMVSPAITHIKENLRHPRTPGHSQDLFKVLHVILETRLLLVGLDMSGSERSDFAAIDTVFKTLYDDVYRNPVTQGGKADATYDDIKLATEAVQGAGALVCQRPANRFIGAEESQADGKLLPEDTCQQICDALFSNIIQSITESFQSRTTNSDELINETAKALQRAIQSFSQGYSSLVEQAMTVVRSWKTQGLDAIPAIQALGPLLGYIGCSELPRVPAEGLKNFLLLTCSLYSELHAAINSKADIKIWCALLASIQAASRNFNDACKPAELVNEHSAFIDQWAAGISNKYPVLEKLGTDHITPDILDRQTLVKDVTLSVSQVRGDFLLIALFVVQSLYHKATKCVNEHSITGGKALDLSEDFSGANVASESQYLHLLATLAGFVLVEMTEDQQLAIGAHNYTLHLFQSDFITTPTTMVEPHSTESLESIAEKGSVWDWLTTGRLSVLSFGILESLRPSGVSKLFDVGVAQELLVSGTSISRPSTHSTSQLAARSILTVLANKHSIEKIAPLMQIIDGQSSRILQNVTADSPPHKSTDLELASSLYAVATGMVRRYSGKQAQALLTLLREAPKSLSVGSTLAHRLEMVVAPQRPLDKESFAIVKPLWRQKIYIELVKPVLETALAPSDTPQGQLVRTNVSIAVLRVVKHLSFSIYEDDAEKILRIAISVAQNLGGGVDAKAALDVLRDIMVEASDQCQPHLRSIITICINAFSTGRASDSTVPEWLPKDYIVGVNDLEVRATGGQVALGIVGGLPQLFEARHLLPHSSQVQKELTLACGNTVRSLRKSARIARAAWASIN